jgi:hypothetical protein
LYIEYFENFKNNFQRQLKKYGIEMRSFNQKPKNVYIPTKPDLIREREYKKGKKARQKEKKRIARWEKE